MQYFMQVVWILSDLPSGYLQNIMQIRRNILLGKDENLIDNLALAGKICCCLLLARKDV
jgi:hypothetical protein